jgi:hypothetical protein
VAEMYLRAMLVMTMGVTLGEMMVVVEGTGDPLLSVCQALARFYGGSILLCMAYVHT